MREIPDQAQHPIALDRVVSILRNDSCLCTAIVANVLIKQVKHRSTYLYIALLTQLLAYISVAQQHIIILIKQSGLLAQEPVHGSSQLQFPGQLHRAGQFIAARPVAGAVSGYARFIVIIRHRRIELHRELFVLIVFEVQREGVGIIVTMV